MEDTTEAARNGLQSAGEFVRNAAENTVDAAQNAAQNVADFFDGDNEENQGSSRS
ncbi:hypothetical protein ACVNS2_14535 [Paenibacillus caseinilyticus]|nr:hypothetical protein [Paenibacillus mucilaginosus]